MAAKYLVNISWRNFLFWLSRIINYPLVPPDTLQLCFTFRCNLKCKMCSMQDKSAELKRYGQPYELPFSLMRDLISQAADMKIKEVLLLGGEPFLEEKIFDLIKHASSLKMRTVVTTNGTTVDDKMIDRIVDSGVSCVTFSIDGPDEETYEKIRGEKVFRRVVENMHNLLSRRSGNGLPGPQVTILCTVMKQNINKLPEMARFAKGMGADLINFQAVVPDNTDQAYGIISDTWITPDTYDILDNGIDNLIKLKNGEFADYINCSTEQLNLMKPYFRGQMPMIRRCYIGFNRLLVTQNYRVYFCVPDIQTGDISFGDVSRVPLARLWRSKEAARYRRQIKACQRPCLLACTYRVEFDWLSEKFNKIMKGLKTEFRLNQVGAK